MEWFIVGALITLMLVIAWGDESDKWDSLDITEKDDDY